MYTHNRAPKCMNQKLIELKGKIDSSIVTVGIFNTPLSLMDRTTKQKTANKQIYSTDERCPLPMCHHIT